METAGDRSAADKTGVWDACESQPTASFPVNQKFSLLLVQPSPDAQTAALLSASYHGE